VRFGAVPARALAVFAHPDDPEVACAGTLATWVDGGCEARVVIANAGDKGALDPSVDAAALIERRAGEVAAAAAVLGLAGCEVLGIPDGETRNDAALQARLVAAIRSWRPEVVIAPDPTAVFFGDTYVNHRDHRELGWAALDACAPMAAFPLYFPEAGAPHRVATVLLAGTLEPDCWVDVAAAVDRKAAALACHRSQLGDDVALVAEVVRARAEEAAAAAASAGTAGLRLAEGFRRLRLG
jgi:LmbE family N-acetylglucosaminyl deacetylase